MSSHTPTAPHPVGSNEAPGPMPYPTPNPMPRRWLALAVLSAAQFMLILDITVVNIALPNIGTDLGLGRDALTWVVTAYTLLFGGLMLVGGRAADLFGARRVMLTGLVVFTAASLAAGFAPTAGLLVAGRAAQGVGAALISPAALSIVTRTFTGADRHRALGVWAALAGSGSAVGVLLGGLLTAGPGWRWVFLINVPIGLAVLATLPALIRADRPRTPSRRIDLPGALLVTGGTAALIYALVGAGDDGWTAPSTLGALAASVVLYLGFTVVQRRVAAPLMNIGLLARRPVAAGTFLMLIATGLLVSGFFLGSFHLQHVAGYGALATGVAFLPIALGTIAGAHIAGRTIGRVGPRPLATAGLLLAAAGIGAVAVSTTAPVLIAGISVAAAGIGATFVAATTTALGHAEPGQEGLTSGIVNTFHELGAAIGVATVSGIAAGSLATGDIGGFTEAFGVSAAAAAGAALLAAVLVPRGRPAAGATPHLH